LLTHLAGCPPSPAPTSPPQGRARIEEEDIYRARENKALESFSELTNAPKPGDGAYSVMI
jgi:hypothetical protein